MTPRANADFAALCIVLALAAIMMLLCAALSRLAPQVAGPARATMVLSEVLR